MRYPTSLRKRRYSRRALVLGAAVAGTGIAAAACSGDKSDSGAKSAAGTAGTSAGTDAQPKKGGELTLAVAAIGAQSLDPHLGPTYGFNVWPFHLNRMIRPNVKTVTPFEGELIASWEQPDSLTYVMSVRQNVKWQEGKPAGGRNLTAADIAFNLMRIAGKLDPSRAASFPRASNLYGMEKAEAVDDRSVKVTFSKPNSAFLAGVADWRNYATSPEQVAKDPSFKDGQNFGGTGPFLVESWDASQSLGTYVPNPNYWDAGKPYVSKIRQVLLPDTASQVSAFLAGKIDFIDVTALETLNTVTKGKSDTVVYSWENLYFDYLGFNQSRAQFGDPRVRQAIAKLIDYKALMDQQYGQGRWSHTSVLVSGLPGAPSADEAAKQSPWDPATKQQDITEAKQLLQAAGFADGAGLEFKIGLQAPGSAGNNHAVRIQDQLKRLLPKVTVGIDTPDAAVSQRELAAGNYDLLSYPSVPPPDAIFDVAQKLYSPGARNYTKFSDAQLDQLVDKVFAEFSAAPRAQLLDQLTRRLLDVTMIVPIGKFNISMAGQKQVQGFEQFTGVGAGIPPHYPVQVAGSLWVNR